MIIINKVNCNRGNLLAEMLVGLSLSLLTLLAVAVISIYFEKQNNINKSLDHTLNNAATAFYSLKMEGRNAGFGLNTNSNAFGCDLQIYNAPNLPSPNSVKLWPAFIDSKSANHRLSFNAGSSYSITMPTTLASGANIKDGSYKTNSVFGYKDKDFIFASPTSDVGNCFLNKISNVDTTSNIISYDTTNINTNATVGSNSSIFNLGQSPMLDTFYVDNQGNLVKQDNVSGEISLLLSNVVAFKAIYATVDSSGNFAWVDPSNMTDSNFKLIRAVKIGLIVRTDIPDSTNKANCDTTIDQTITNTLYDLGAGVQLSIPNVADAKCYSYRYLTTTIPLKNMIHNKLN